jgi:hypothetical protein
MSDNPPTGHIDHLQHGGPKTQPSPHHATAHAQHLAKRQSGAAPTSQAAAASQPAIDVVGLIVAAEDGDPNVQRIYSSETLVITATYENLGDDAPAGQVRLWLDQEHHDAQLPAIPSLGRQAVDWYHAALAAGMHTMRAQVSIDANPDYATAVQFYVQPGHAPAHFAEGEETHTATYESQEALAKKTGLEKAYISLTMWDVDENGVEGLPLLGEFQIDLVGQPRGGHEPHKVSYKEHTSNNGTLQFHDCYITPMGSLSVHGFDDDGRAQHGTLPKYELKGGNLYLKAQRKHYKIDRKFSTEDEAKKAYHEKAGADFDIKVVHISAEVAADQEKTHKAGQETGYEAHFISKALDVTLAG